jgi:hypothetical protein
MVPDFDPTDFPDISAAALNVTEPCNCGIGGDIFVLYWNEKEKSLKGLNGSGRSPAALSLEKARELGIKGREMYEPFGSWSKYLLADMCARTPHPAR